MQDWEFALLLCALSLKIAHFKEQLWVIWSCRSLKYCRAIVSKSLSSLFNKERRWVICSLCSLKKAIVSKSLSLFFKEERLWANCSHHSLKKCDHEQIACIALNKRATFVIRLWFSLSFSKIRDSLQKKITFFWQFFIAFPLLCPRVNRSPCILVRRSLQKSDPEWFALFHGWIAFSLFRSPKTSNSLANPKSKFPTRKICDIRELKYKRILHKIAFAVVKLYEIYFFLSHPGK